MTNYQFKDGILYCRPAGDVSFDEATSLAVEALKKGRELKAGGILLNARELTGFDVPSLIERYLFAVAVAENGRRIPFSIVTSKEMIHPERFGVIVARNRGAVADVFESEPEAEAWLSSVIDTFEV